MTTFHGVPDEHFAAVGKIASAWSLFEACIDIAIWRLAKISPETGACLTSQISGSSRKLDALISLAHHQKQTSLLPRLNKVAEGSRSLAEQRNRVIHDFWSGDDTGATTRFEATARRRVVLEHKAVTTETLMLLVEAILDHTTIFQKVADDLFKSAESAAS